jgi:hypothetical protein
MAAEEIRWWGVRVWDTTLLHAAAAAAAAILVARSVGFWRFYSLWQLGSGYICILGDTSRVVVGISIIF